MAIDNSNCALMQGTTATAGAGPFVVSDVAGRRSFSLLANGTEITVTRSDDAGNFEDERVTVSTVGGVTTMTVVARGKTSAGGTAPVTWSGTQNVVPCALGGETPCKSNNGSEYGITAQGLSLIQQATAALQRTALGLGSAATLAAGVAASNVVQLDGSAFLPQLSGPLPAVTGQTGGSAGKVVRLTSADTWVDAANTNTQTQLCILLFLNNSRYYRPGERVTGLSGLTTGSNYWLGTAGAITTSPPTPSSSVCSVLVGKAISTTELLFLPQIPVVGA